MRHSHSSPRLCIHVGARRTVPATKLMTAPGRLMAGTTRPAGLRPIHAWPYLAPGNRTAGSGPLALSRSVAHALHRAGHVEGVERQAEQAVDVAFEIPLHPHPLCRRAALWLP